MFTTHNPALRYDHPFRTTHDPDSFIVQRLRADRCLAIYAVAAGHKALAHELSGRESIEEALGEADLMERAKENVTQFNVQLSESFLRYGVDRAFAELKDSGIVHTQKVAGETMYYLST